jgi:hypothetical protein
LPPRSSTARQPIGLRADRVLKLALAGRVAGMELSDTKLWTP